MATAAVGRQSGPTRLPIGRAGDGGHDSGVVYNNRVFGRLELAPKAIPTAIEWKVTNSN